MHQKKIFKEDLSEIMNLLYVLTGILLFSLCGKFLIVFFDKYIVDQVIYIIYSDRLSLFETFIAIAIVFYCLYIVIEKLSKPRYNLKYSYILLLAIPLIWYLYERFQNHKYVFTTIFDPNKFNCIKFLDLPFILIAIIIIILVANRLRVEKQVTNNDLIIDLPLKLVHEDNYERKQVYEGLLKQISSLNFEEDKSFCVGVANSWGEGKTSFLNFLEQRLIADTETIIIKFNPWFNSNSDNLTLDFFHTLDKELSKYIYTGSVLRKYATNLTAINSVFNPFKYLPPNWISEKSNQSYFDDINNLIKRIDRRIFIFIDDLDRLDNKEVFNLIRTIRNTANFTRTHFVIPFDKAYVINALNENKIFKPEEYLKKIFDVEVVLPPISKENLQRMFYGLFESFFSEKLPLTEKQNEENLDQLKRIIYNEGYNFSIKSKYTLTNNFLFNMLKNKRDLIRFFNGIALAIQTNHSWVYLPDLIILETIKYFNVDFYKKIFENDYYLGKKTDGLGNQYYLVRKKNDAIDDFLGDALQRRKGDYFLEDCNLDKDFLYLIYDLFKLPDDKEFNARYAFAYSVNFHNYLQYRENGITYDDINNLLNE
ncbi:MAG: hypothetical protein EOO90_20100 [Pedobacter sp.]|nr:MAG: hypothetical protein EOO90_20100 [Pedobacter sp.]